MIYVIMVLAIVSVGWAFWSLRALLKEGKYHKEVKKSLKLGRVVYDSSASEDSSSAKSE